MRSETFFIRVLSFFCVLIFVIDIYSTPSGTAQDSQLKLSETVQLHKLAAGDVVELLINFDRKSDEEYRFSVGDMITILFISSPELTFDQRIRPDGKIVIPYIGDIAASGFTAAELRKSISTLLSEELNNPEVLVILKEAMGKIAGIEAIFTSSYGRTKVLKIRDDGMLDLPMAGEIKIAGFTVKEAESAIADQYKKSDINITVSVILKSAEGSRIAIIGAVFKPGYYVIENRMNIAAIVGLAGGLRDDAQNQVYITKMTNGSIETRKIDLNRMLTGRSNEWITVDAGDILFIPRTGLTRAAYVAKSIGELIFFRGMSIDIGRFMTDY